MGLNHETGYSLKMAINMGSFIFSFLKPSRPTHYLDFGC